MDPRLQDLLGRLSPAGLSPWGLVDAAAWDAVAREGQRSADLLPGARQLLVLASGGDALWRALLADLEAHPDHLLGEPHPLDAFVRRAVTAADAALGEVPRRWVFASAEETTFLDFRLLAERAGLGARGHLGLLMHPTHGPWMGLRAACVLGAALGPASAPIERSPCTGCPRPCAVACPGGAFDGGRFSIRACAAFHQRSETCAVSCASREACPEGAASRYPPDEVRYHANRLIGRAALRRRLGLADADDPHAGDPLAWAAWAD